MHGGQVPKLVNAGGVNPVAVYEYCVFEVKSEILAISKPVGSCEISCHIAATLPGGVGQPQGETVD